MPPPSPPISKRDFLFGKFPDFAHCPSGKISMQMKMSMEYKCNDTDMGKPNYTEKTLPRCHFNHHKSLMAWPENEPGPPD